jgi:predicted cupin superfamily sugar epimerase
VTPSNPAAEARARALGLAPHPEGGWFRETYRSSERLAAALLPARFGGDRALSTSILYLLGAGERSRFHRLRADEVWSHHEGGVLHLHLLEPEGPRVLELGPATPQQVIGHGTWFAAEPAPGTEYVLVGCHVAPGFEFEDLEMATRAALLAQHPAHHDLVVRFTPEVEDPTCP